VSTGKQGSELSPMSSPIEKTVRVCDADFVTPTKGAHKEASRSSPKTGKKKDPGQDFTNIPHAALRFLKPTNQNVDFGTMQNLKPKVCSIKVRNWNFDQ